jgi:hypothetical protein
MARRLATVAERCSSLGGAIAHLRLKAECRPSTKWELERETGLEPATFSLEGLSGYAQWPPSWEAEHFVSSYRVVVSRLPNPKCPGVMTGSRAGHTPPMRTPGPMSKSS